MVKTRLKSAALSDVGRVRKNNEDACHVDAERGIYLVVDGIGGQAAGEKAAEIAVDRVRARLERLTGTVEQRIREAITMANNEIFEQARSRPEWEGMACVLTVAVLENGSAVVGHVGDSRLYHVRGGKIRKITHDHSPVGEREDSGEISEAEAMRHPRRNEVFRDVGSQEHAPDDAEFIEILRIPFEPDSALLLCSDGLSDQVPSAAIRQAVERNAGNPEAAVQELIDAANRAGGKDNVTVVIVEGDQFTAPVEVPQSRSNWFVPLMALVGIGLLATAYAVWRYTNLRPQTVTRDPRTLFVSERGPWTNISAALAEAKDGDTVIVPPGEYRETVALKGGVNVIARPPLGAILRAAALSTGPAVVANHVAGARFTGFSIQADPAMPLTTGILLVNSNVEVDDNEISGAGNGIEIQTTAEIRPSNSWNDFQPHLLANAVRDCTGIGVLITGPVQPWMSHNSILRNKVGLVAREGARPSMVGNVFEKNGLDLPADMDLPAIHQNNFFLEMPAPRRTAPRGGRGETKSGGRGDTKK
jgi:serine/threonine protein phosphatase PrpC